MAGIEAIPFGILIFVVGALLIANIWAVIDAKAAVDAAAREATRSYVESQVDGTATPDAASDAAVQAGLAALEAQGRDPVPGHRRAQRPRRCRRPVRLHPLR